MPNSFEGSALILYGALGAGLGIIQSAAAGFGVQTGRTGFLLLRVLFSSIAATINQVIDNPEVIHRWSRNYLAMA